MGGVLPLGYEVRERKLVVNHDDAKTVRDIFERYIELGNARLLRNDLFQHGIVSSAKVSRKGTAGVAISSHAAPFTTTSPTRSISARSGTRANGIPDNTRRW
jgi:hypothetical protein